jgi:hypothetical protein
MNKPLGGRGKKAPYETVLIRIPVPVYSIVEKIADDYRRLVIEGEVNSLEEKSNDRVETTQVKYDDALQRAKEILKQKRSAAESIAKLLQVLYGGTVSKEDLK